MEDFIEKMKLLRNEIDSFIDYLEKEEHDEKKFRKTGEIVDVISYNKYTTTKRNSELDWVSYVDSKGVEHDTKKD